MNTYKRLYKSDDKIFAGVCGGIAEYFGIDPTLIRILTVVLIIASFGFTIFAYLIAMIVIPKRTEGYREYIDVQPMASGVGPGAGAAVNGEASSGGSTGAGAAGATAAAGSGVGVTTGASSGFAAGMSMGAEGTVETGSGANAKAATTGSAPEASKASYQTQTAHYPYASQSAPGCGYTTCNPVAFDANSPSEGEGGHDRSKLRAGVITGLVIVTIGIFALIGIFFKVSIWQFWPVLIIVAGIATLFTPGRHGWSLARAGNGILLIVAGSMLQLWTLHIVEWRAFVLTFLNLWPVLVVAIGLSIIANATDKHVFTLLGSLLISFALLFGIWNFGQIDLEISVPLPGNIERQLNIPSPRLGMSDEGGTIAYPVDIDSYRP